LEAARVEVVVVEVAGVLDAAAVAVVVVVLAVPAGVGVLTGRGWDIGVS
jgi:hypothetical protein